MARGPIKVSAALGGADVAKWLAGRRHEDGVIRTDVPNIVVVAARSGVIRDIDDEAGELPYLDPGAELEVILGDGFRPELDFEDNLAVAGEAARLLREAFGDIRPTKLRIEVEA